MAIPSTDVLSVLQPFTISTAPHEVETKFHIRKLGDWTRKLAKLVDRDGITVSEEYSKRDSAHIRKSLNLEVVVEGPFGIPSIDLMNLEYRVYLFITGGIGKCASEWRASIYLCHTACYDKMSHL
jgi:predicted ferric reductase